MKICCLFVKGKEVFRPGGFRPRVLLSGGFCKGVFGPGGLCPRGLCPTPAGWGLDL